MCVELQSVEHGDSSLPELDYSSGEPFFVRRWASEVGLANIVFNLVYGNVLPNALYM